MTPSPKKDGGPAFPTDCLKENLKEYGGMTMRQAYKLAALQGICSNQTFLANLKGNGPADKNVALACGEIADALIAEDEEWEKGNTSE